MALFLTFIQEKLQKLTKILQKDLILQTWNSQSKIRETRKVEKKGILSPFVFLVMKLRKNLKSMYQKSVAKKIMLIYY